MALAEVFQSVGDTRKEFDFLQRYSLRESDDSGVLFGGDLRLGELLEAGDQRSAEALKAVAVLGDGGTLAKVEVLANFFVGVDAVIEVGDEGGNGALEVDVVLPEGVVSVEEQRLLLKF